MNSHGKVLRFATSSCYIALVLILNNVIIIIKISTYLSEVSSREHLYWRWVTQFDSESLQIAEK